MKIVNKGSTININFFKILKILQQTKYSMNNDFVNFMSGYQTKYAQYLFKFNNPQEPRSTFLPGNCIPIIYFVFQAPKHFPSKYQATEESKVRGQNKSEKNLPIEEKLKKDLEKQLRLLLRRRTSNYKEREGYYFPIFLPFNLLIFSGQNLVYD